MRSVMSHAIHDIGCGNWNVVNREREERSQSCRISSEFSIICVKADVLTFTEWSREDVRTRHVGKGPTPQMMSVTGRVWSESVQYGVGISFWRSSSSNL
jgi:hypothetical protein